MRCAITAYRPKNLITGAESEPSTVRKRDIYSARHTRYYVSEFIKPRVIKRCIIGKSRSRFQKGINPTITIEWIIPEIESQWDNWVIAP